MIFWSEEKSPELPFKYFKFSKEWIFCSIGLNICSCSSKFNSTFFVSSRHFVGITISKRSSSGFLPIIWSKMRSRTIWSHLHIVFLVHIVIRRILTSKYWVLLENCHFWVTSCFDNFSCMVDQCLPEKWKKNSKLLFHPVAVVKC